MVPDPTTFRVLPWLNRTGWMLCDVYYADGSPVGFSTRQLLRRQLERLPAGQQFITGLEVEFHILKLLDPALGLQDGGQPGTPPQVELTHHGYQHLTEMRLDRVEPIVDILRRETLALGLDLTSVELEYGPSQVEFVFRAAPGMKSADDMVLFRSAVKQICRRQGYHATFMCRPAFPECDVQWLASASVPGRRIRTKSFRARSARAVVVSDGSAVPGRVAARRSGIRRLHHAHHQWLQAIPAAVARPGSRCVVA